MYLLPIKINVIKPVFLQTCTCMHGSTIQAETRAATNVKAVNSSTGRAIYWQYVINVPDRNYFIHPCVSSLKVCEVVTVHLVLVLLA